MKIVVLAGGLSTERTVSLASGSAACKALRACGHKAVMVDMFMGLENYHGDLADIFDAPDGLCAAAVIGETAPDLDAVRRSRADHSASLLGKDVLKVCAMADIVFLGLHGACGEDGRVQAALDLIGVPYTGAGYLSSAKAMDKAETKRAMDAAGILTAPWREVCYEETDIPRLVEELPLPCAVKPANGGSSIGVGLPETKEELREALHLARRYCSRVVVEQKIRGREMACGVLGDRYLPAVEIIPKGSQYFDYAAKYQSGGASEVCPANVTEDEAKAMGEAALKLHRALGLSVYSRSDFLLTPDGKAYCLEVNTLPGLTPMSLLPKEAAAIGISYEDLCEWIVNESLKVNRW